MVKIVRSDTDSTSTLMVQFPANMTLEQARAAIEAADAKVAVDLKDIAGAGPFLVIDVPAAKMAAAIAQFESLGAHVYENPPIKPFGPVA